MEVSVITAVFNGEKFLEATITSVLKQTFREFEYILVDDGSTDRSAAIIEAYRKQDSRIVVVSQANTGIAASLNNAISASRATLVAHIDQDDVALPNWLERQMFYLSLNPDCSVVSSFAYFINADGKRIGVSRNPINVEKGRADKCPKLFLDVVHSTVLMRRVDVQNVGGYRRGMLGVEDRDLWGRLVTAGFMIRCNPACLVEYRLHGGSATVKKRSSSEKYARIGIDENIVRRLRGEAELSSVDLELWFKSRPLGEKLTTWRRVKSNDYYMRASRHFAERRWVSLARELSLALALRPFSIATRIALRLQKS